MAVVTIYRTSAFGPALPPRLVTGGVALFANGTGTVSFDHLRTTQYPDPSTSLASVGRAVNSVANWNANVPANTSITVSTSLDDGATYQAVATAGNTIAGISTSLFSTLVYQKQPISYLRFDDTSGTVALDTSGNGYNGTYAGGYTLAQTGVLQGPGETTDTAVLLDGTSGYITLDSRLNTGGLSQFSCAFWIKLTSTLTGYPGLIGNDTPSSTHNGFAVFLAPPADGATGYIDSGNGSSYKDLPFGTGALTAGQWYHLAFVFDGSNLTVYINGESVASTSFSGVPTAGAYSVTIGQYASGGGYTGATIDEAFFLENASFSASDVFALYNAGLAGVGSEANDSFIADTHTSYTQTYGTGGSAATWTWDTANSRLVASGGSKAVLLYNSLYAYDTDMLTDFYQSENGGLAWGWQNASNYYEMVIRDSAAASSANTLTINKVSGGTSSQLATASIAFTTQTYHRFHLTMLSGVITAYMDGTKILTYTDASPFPAGLAGIRNDTGTSYCYLYQMTPQSVDLSSKFLCTKQSLVTSDPTATPQITDHQSLAGDSSFGVGSSIASADYRSTVVSDNLDNLNTQSNYWWRIKANQILFTPRNADDAPYILQPTDVLLGTMPTVEYSGDMYRNRQVLTGVFDTAVFTQPFNGDGQTRTWNVVNPIISPPTITLNNASASVGVQSVDTGKQFYWQNNNNGITQDNSQPVLTASDTLTVQYTGSYAIDFSVDNTGQFSGTTSQSQMAIIDGTDGVTEAVEDVSSQNMNKAAATTYANQLLQRYGTIARTITFQTLHTGLQIGHSLPVFIPQLNIFDSVFLVVQINTSVRTLATGQIQYVYDVTASEAASLASWGKLFSKVLRSVKGTSPKVKA